MNIFTVTLLTPEGDEKFLTHDGNVTECADCATHFIDAVTAEIAATRAMGYGWAFMIEQMEI
jgi:hypothetical protein